MAELPKVVKSVIDGCHDFAANSNKAESKSALRRLFYLLYTGMKINPEEYKVPLVRFIMTFAILTFFVSGMWASWITKSSIPGVRENAAAAVVNNKIYVVGGNTDLTTLEEYTPQTDSWTTRTSMPTGRMYLVAETVNNKIYAIGGYGPTGTFHNVVEEYDVVSDIWTVKTSMPTIRCMMSIAVVNGKIYVIGGHLSTGQYTNKVEEYNPSTDIWTEKTSMPVSREGLRCVAINNKIYAMGGYNGQGSYLTTVQEYDPSTDSWNNKTPMPTARYNFGLCAVKGEIYAFGGITNDSYWTGSVDKYDPATDTWQTNIDMNMPTARRAFSTGVINDRIYAIGGNKGNPLATNEEGTLSANAIIDTIPPISSVTSPNKPAYDYQWIDVNGIASQDTAKVEVQIYQHESNTYWDGQCWVGEINWLLCKVSPISDGSDEGTTLWDYPISTYFSDNLKYTIKSRATDASDNTETPSDGITFVIDKKPPTSYVSFPQDGKTYSDVEKIYGQAQDSGVGVAFVRVRLKDLTDGTYWSGKDWVTNEIWVKADGVAAFSLTIPVWKVGHQYNVTSQAVDFGTLEQGIYSGWNFSITSALTLSATTSKLKYGYGEPIALEISFENTAKSTQVVEFPSSKIYDFTIDSVYRYSDGKTFTPSATFISFRPGKTIYAEMVNKILTVSAHLLTAEVESTAAAKLTSKTGFEVVSDIIAPTITFQAAAVDQFKYFSLPVCVKVTDNSGISTVNLHSGNHFWQMTKITEDLWSGTIPAEYNTSSSLSYYAEAVDMSGNKTATNVITINTKDVPAPEADEIAVTPAPAQEENIYLIGITNFAALDDIYYRVYYDKGTGKIDYTSWIGTIDDNNNSVTTPKLNPGTEYNFSIVPVIPELDNLDVEISSIPAVRIIIKTPPDDEEKDEDNTGGDGGVIILPPFLPGDPLPVPPWPEPPSPEPPSPQPPSPEPPSPEPPGVKLIPGIPGIPIPLPHEPGIVIQKFPITIKYNDFNQDGYLDGTTIKETTLVILRYDDIKKMWVGGFETIVNIEKNSCSAFVDSRGTYAVFSALYIYPAGVKNLSGIGTEKFEAKIEWSPSPSATIEQYNIYYQNEFYCEKNYSAKYYIYWDRGTGTIDYSKAIADVNPHTNGQSIGVGVNNPATSWTTPALETGLYRFAVRVVDIEGTEEKNTNYVTVNIGKKGEASADIRVPKNGQRLNGNAVTIIANASPNTTGVMFQYRATNDANWTTISVIDNKPPYAVYLDISKLTNGEYKLRAVAYDLLKIAQDIPSEITVYVDDVNWDISEKGNPELDPNIPHNKQEKITGTGDAEIFTADGTGAVVPEGVAENGTILNITEIETLPVPNSSIQSIDVFREYEFSNGTTEFEDDVTIYLPYPDENNDGVVDGTDIATETLEIYYLDEEKNEWKKADNRSGLGDGTNPGQGDGRDNAKNDGTDNPNNKNKGSSTLKGALLSSTLTKTISAKVKHFTKFGIFAKTPRVNLDNVSIYPNPFKPSVHTYITFDGLTESVKIKIYTIAGRLVDEFETATDGSYTWTPDIASGVYIYYIEDENGKGKAKGKIGIIR